MATVLPFVMPNLYRPDPATGSEMRELQGEIDRLRRDVDEFLREGPREVRANQDRILVRLDAILRALERHHHGQGGDSR